MRGLHDQGMTPRLIAAWRWSLLACRRRLWRGRRRVTAAAPRGEHGTQPRARRAACSTQLGAADVDSLDPGYGTTRPTTRRSNTTQRQLYGWKPDETKPNPDLAEACRRSPTAARPSRSSSSRASSTARRFNRDRQVGGRQVRARALLPAAGRQRLRQRYYGDIEGCLKTPDKKADEISGIETPDDQTLVINSAKPSGVSVGGGARHAVHRAGAEGVRPEVRRGEPVDLRPAPRLHRPVHDRERRQGQDHRLRAGQGIDLVRNPSWDKSTDFKPAYFDKISETNAPTPPSPAGRALGPGT